jgi:hypothetical protein
MPAALENRNAPFKILMRMILGRSLRGTRCTRKGILDFNQGAIDTTCARLLLMWFEVRGRAGSPKKSQREFRQALN